MFNFIKSFFSQQKINLKKINQAISLPKCSRSRILGNATAKSGNSEKTVISHFKRILTANFEKIKRPLN